MSYTKAELKLNVLVAVLQQCTAMQLQSIFNSTIYCLVKCWGKKPTLGLSLKPYYAAYIYSTVCTTYERSNSPVMHKLFAK